MRLLTSTLILTPALIIYFGRNQEYTFAKKYKLMMVIFYWIVLVPSLRPNVSSTTERDEKIKIGLPESSGKKQI